MAKQQWAVVEQQEFGYMQSTEAINCLYCRRNNGKCPYRFALRWYALAERRVLQCEKYLPRKRRRA